MLPKVSATLLQPPSLLLASDIPLACELFEQVFKHTVQPNQWRWKYQQGPRLGAINVVIKSQSGQLMAHAGASVFEGQYINSKGLIQRIPMAQVCDVMVHPSARNAVTHQGAYGQVIHALQTQLAIAFPGVYAYGFAGIRPYKLGVKMGLYHCHQDCRMGHLELNDKPSGRFSLGALLSSLFNSEKLTLLPLNAQDPSEFLKHQAQFDEWSQAWSMTDALKILRTAAYVQWRFVQNPNANYKIWLYEKNDAPKAWFVTRELNPGHLTVVDALMHPQVQKKATEQLFQQHLFHETQAQAHAISSWHFQTEESLRLEPIKACEVKVGDWHACKPPQFWPADTDVF